MSDWQPIATAPHATDEWGLSEYVLLYLPDHDGRPWVTIGMYFRLEERTEDGRFKGGGWTGVDWDGLPTGDLAPTHWQPLPKPPCDSGSGPSGRRPERAPDEVPQSGLSDSEGIAQIPDNPKDSA